MRHLLFLGIAFCAVQYSSVEGRSFSSSEPMIPENENERDVNSPTRAKRFDPYPYDDGKEDLIDKRFDPYQKRFDAYEKRFDPYQKRFDAYEKRFEPYQKRFDPYQKRTDYDEVEDLDKRFNLFQKRFDPYQKRLDSFMGSSIRRRRVNFTPIDARAFFVALG